MKKRKVQTILCVSSVDGYQFLILQMNTRRNHYWQNVTGSVENNESYKDAAIREAQEETGLELENIEKVITVPIEFEFTDQRNNQVHEKVFFIQCKNQWNITLDPNEHEDFRWIHQNDLNRSCVHYQSNFDALVKASLLTR